MAAEKNIFDLAAFDEECNRIGDHYVAALPSGTLSLHIKLVKKLDETHVTIPDPEIYVRIRVGKYIKCTQTTTVDKGRAVVDDIRHFSITVSRKRDDPSNEVRIDLIVVESPHVHRIIGHKDMHLYDIIKNLYVAGTYELKYRQHTIAEVELEGCFAYGIFGFGYSHQLENRQKKLSDIVGHSLLLRVEPPDNRKQANSNVMAPMPVGHPEIINFAEEVKIGNASAEVGRSSSALDVFAGMEKHEPIILARTMRKRLHRIQTDFAQQSGRLQRKRFLEKLIVQHVDDQRVPIDEAEPNQKAGSEDLPGSAKNGWPTSTQPVVPLPASSLLAVTTDTYGEDDDYAASETDVAEIGNFLQNAPGIVRRAAPARGMPPPMPSVTTILEDEVHIPSTSDKISHPSSPIADSAADTMDHEQDQQRSTLTELPGALVRGFAGRLRAWRSTRTRQTPETRTSSLVEGPSTSSTQSSQSTTPSVSAFRRRIQTMVKDGLPFQ